MVDKEYQIIANNFDLAGRASSDIKRTLKELNINPGIIKKVCASSYEAEINVVIHSVGGYVTFHIDEDEIVLDFYDDGPGIFDIELAMLEGYTTANSIANSNGFGAGMGLSNINRSADKLEIESDEFGTHLRATFFLRGNKHENF
jgi:serine/threonine-protein kinase RsbT